MGKIIFENEKGFVKETTGGAYEVYKHGARVLDGIYETGVQYLATYGKHYWRDWLGRSGSIYYEHDPRETAISQLK